MQDVPSNGAVAPSDQEEMKEDGSPPSQRGKSYGNDSGSFVTALAFQRLYPTLPDDIAHTPPAELRSSGSGQEEFETAVSPSGSEGSGRVKVHPHANGGEFVTAPQSPEGQEDTPSPAAQRKLTRNSLTRAKRDDLGQESSQHLLSPTVPINYAIQQLSEGKKDAATIRKELAEMCSERVSTDPEPASPLNPARLGKRKVQFAELPLARSASMKRHCDGEAADPQQFGEKGGERERGGSRMPRYLPPASSAPPSHPTHRILSPSPSRSPSRQSDSWFAKLFRNKQ